MWTMCDEKENINAPRFEINEIPVIKMSSASQESLIQGNVELPGGVSNPVFTLEEPSSARQSEVPVTETTPVLNVEEASSGKPSPEPEYFTFDSEAIRRFKSQPRRGSVAGGTNPPHRISLESEKRISDPGAVQNNGFLIPDIQHTNHGIQFTHGDIGDKPSNSWDSFPSDNGLNAAPTPGLLGINNGYDKLGQPPPSPGLLSINSVWSELAKIHSRRSSTYTESNESSFRSGSLSNLSSSLSEHLHNLVRAFSSRTERVKASTAVPPSPSTSPDLDYDANSDALSAISMMEEPPQRTHRIDSFIPGHKPTPVGEPLEEHHYFSCFKSRKLTCKVPKVFEPQSKIYMTWLFLVTLVFMYNSYSVPLRAAFQDRYMNKENLLYWLIADYVADFIYLLDILVFKPRLTYLVSGVNETDVAKTRKHYMKKNIFKFDVLSLMPLDIFYFATGIHGTATLLRLPRLMKIQTFWEFYQRCDQAIRSAHILRILKTMTYMLFLIHVETCGYYAVSSYEGLGINRWVYNGIGNAYIRCFYFATKTATSIGKIKRPTNDLEYIFMTVYWLSGVFVFALLVGQIRDIVESAQRVKTLYDKRMETALRYVKNLNLPKEMIEKVRVWFLFNWNQQKVLDEEALMNTLPTRLRTDLAIHVHFNTLSKVKLFQDCDKSLLYNLVLKLKPILYLPGEYVCRKGEVGKEMYIVSQGIVEVVGGPENSLVFATLQNGSVFGEISLLSVGTEGNRRTADVRVKGFTNLFMLSKADFESAMSEFPAAHKMLKKRARKLLAQNAKMTKKESESSLGGSKVEVEEIIHPQPREQRKTPKLLTTVLQLIKPEAGFSRKLGTSNDEVHHSDDTNDNSDKPNDIDTNHNTERKTSQQDNSDNVTGDKKSLTAAEVEDFYDEILRATEGNPQTFEEAIRNPLKRDSTNHTDDSIDSGVQVNKPPSSPSSSTKTISNKDLKESGLDNNQNSELLAEFFEDCIHNDSNDIREKGESITNANGMENSQSGAGEKTLKKGGVKQDVCNKKNSVAPQSQKVLNSPRRAQNNSEQNGKSKDSKFKNNDNDKKNDKPALGLLTKPGSKRPNFIGLKAARKITPEIHIENDHLTKPQNNCKKQMEKSSSTKPVKLSKPSKETHSVEVKVHNGQVMDRISTASDSGSVNKNGDSIGDTDSQLERNILEIMDDEIMIQNEDLKANENQNKMLAMDNKDYKQQISKIEASITSLNSEIEKADALLRDLCSDDEDLITFEPKEKKNNSDLKNVREVKLQEAKTKTENDNTKDKTIHPLTYTIPAKNQITCSVEVHREKSLTPLDLHGDLLTPISLTEWIENANQTLRKRKESSTSSIFNETGV